MSDLDLLVQGYYELYPDKTSERVYFFFDEIQSVKNWELFIRRLYDTLNVSIFLTGSSSKLLSKDIPTALRGRTIVYEIFPFSFREYLKYLKININLYSSNSISYIQHAFQTYIKNGGFVETFDQSEDIKKRILIDYRDLIIYKDIVERYNIRNQSLLKHLIKYIFVNMGTLISLNRIYNEYRSWGYNISKDALFEYVSYLQESFAIFLVPIFRNSVREEQRNPRKVYIIDNGFKKIYDASLSTDYSKLYENLAFLHIRRYTNQIYFFKDRQEVDFYIKVKGGILINVCYDIENKTTLERELNALQEGMKYFKLKSSYLITFHKEETIKIKNKTIYNLYNTNVEMAT